MTEAIAIDFGTTRTKVAYWDERTSAPRLANLGYGDKPEVPSLFHLSRDSDQISWGYDAEELLEEDPAGIVEVLKRRLQDRYVYANRRKVSPQELLTLMFRHLREQVGQEVLALNGTPPAKAYLTLPALYGPAVEKLLREAAQAADFTDVELIPEPVAAARAWLTEAGETGRSVVVLDCGGGTLDLAYLGYENGQFRIIPECPPGGDTHVGGHDVDRELLNLLREQLPDAADDLEARQPFYLRQVRVLKERFCRNLPVRPLKVADQTLELKPEDIQSILQERFISQTCESLKAYMARVVALTGGEQPPVLLVGGSARIKGLKEAIEGEGDFRTLWWEQSEFATVLGAVSAPIRKHQPVLQSEVAASAPLSRRIAAKNAGIKKKKKSVSQSKTATYKKTAPHRKPELESASVKILDAGIDISLGEFRIRGDDKSILKNGKKLANFYEVERVQINKQVDSNGQYVYQLVLLLAGNRNVFLSQFYSDKEAKDTARHIEQVTDAKREKNIGCSDREFHNRSSVTSRVVPVVFAISFCFNAN
jgi:actin-like ATPase involved in cell morphogenesis